MVSYDVLNILQEKKRGGNSECRIIGRLTHNHMKACVMILV